MKKEEILNLATLFNGDNIEVIRTLPENSIDSIVTDPPYGISFMNKKWDHDVPSVEFWKEIFRVLKPGGHVLSFGGTRTYHRMVVNMEYAGFEIRDLIMWIYGSGFPKSLNIGKEVDKKLGNKREVVGVEKGAGSNKFTDGVNGLKPEYENTKGTSPYEGWGTGLKPANEPICLARKPIEEKTITDNVLKYGTGGINIDGCRIDIKGKDLKNRLSQEKSRRIENNKHNEGFLGSSKIKPNLDVAEGRFPANIIFDESAGEILDEQSGDSISTKRRAEIMPLPKTPFNGEKTDNGTDRGFDDEGGASRFFYIPKTSKKEKELGIDNEKCKTTHPTIKPIELMRYLVRLVTPKGGVIMDPFMGSGSTGVAALLESFQFVGIELDENYFEIALQRVNNHEKFSQFFEEKEIKKEKTNSKSKKKNPSDDPKLGFWAGQGLRMAS